MTADIFREPGKIGGTPPASRANCQVRTASLISNAGEAHLVGLV